MKRTFLICLAALLVDRSTSAEIIAQWNFNSPIPDGKTSAGTLEPGIGGGKATLIGGVTGTYATGSTNDPATSDNSGWNTSSYPTQATGNKTAGVRFGVSTAGYSNIQIDWDHRVSATASKYCRLQCSSDGVNFYDYPTPMVAAAVSSQASYFESESSDLQSFPEFGDNPNFAFRIVSEFEGSATGMGVDGYVTTYATNNYSRSGTIRFDMVTISGQLLPGANTTPTISQLDNLALRVNQSSAPLSFTIGDKQDAPYNLSLDAATSDAVLVPIENILFAGIGANRTVIVNAGNAPGACTVTIFVRDTGGKSASTSFVVTVLPADTRPVISAFLTTNALMNTPVGPIDFEVRDLETPADALSVFVASGNPALVPNQPANLLLEGTQSNRTLTVIPAKDEIGVAPITVTVTDGTNQTSSAFALVVTPSTEVLLYDPFSYPNGSLTTNSGFLWDRRSGTYGQCQITNGQLLLTARQTEDVGVPLFGGPLRDGAGRVLYSSFRVTFLALPKIIPGCFAHFVYGNLLRGRIFAGTTNASPGRFRLFVANGSNSNTMLAQDLVTNRTYTVLSRYDIDSASTTLWIDPASESAGGVTATDSQRASPIASFGFRQDSDLGADLLVDDLRIGVSFKAVLASAHTTPVTLTIQQFGDEVVLHWAGGGLALQSSWCPFGPFSSIPNAASPFTNHIRSSAQFFRLAQN